MRPVLALILFALLATPLVAAEIDFDADLTPEEEAAFDEILSPVMKIYRFIQYAVTVIAVLMLVFAGITFVTSGGDQAKKERAKQMGFGVVIGLVLVWIAPLIVRFIIS